MLVRTTSIFAAETVTMNYDVEMLPRRVELRCPERISKEKVQIFVKTHLAKESPNWDILPAVEVVAIAKQRVRSNHVIFH